MSIREIDELIGPPLPGPSPSSFYSDDIGGNLVNIDFDIGLEVGWALFYSRSEHETLSFLINSTTVDITTSPCPARTKTGGSNPVSVTQP